MLAAFVAVASGCAAAPEKRTLYDLCAQGVHRTSEGTLRVCAQLNETTLAEVERQLVPEDREIVLTSGGGPSGPAMDFARLLNERRITVRARQFCLSACATYVLLTAERVVVEPNAVVAFHHTAAFTLDLMAYRAGLPGDAPARDPGLAERAFFRTAGLDEKLLDRLAVAVDPICVGTRTTAAGREAYLNYRWAWFTPSRSEAESLFRGRLSGYWPASRDEVQPILRATLGNDRLNVRYGWPEFGETDPAVFAATLPNCDGD